MFVGGVSYLKTLVCLAHYLWTLNNFLRNWHKIINYLKLHLFVRIFEPKKLALKQFALNALVETIVIESVHISRVQKVHAWNVGTSTRPNHLWRNYLAKNWRFEIFAHRPSLVLWPRDHRPRLNDFLSNTVSIRHRAS